MDEEIATAHDRIKIISLTVIAGTMGPQSATLTLDIDGQHVTVQSTGNGPVDAIFKAIRELVPHEAKLELYQVHAVTEGTDAQAEVSVRLSEDGRSYTAKGADPDTLVASAKAYLGALNKLTSKRNRTPGGREPHSLDRRRLKFRDECKMPPRQGRHFCFWQIGSVWNRKITFCPHFVRFWGGIGGYRRAFNQSRDGDIKRMKRAVCAGVFALATIGLLSIVPAVSAGEMGNSYATQSRYRPRSMSTASAACSS